MTVLGSLLRPSPSNAMQVTATSDWGSPSGPSWAGVNVNTTSALQLLTVYGCNRFICDGISTLPVDVLRRSRAGTPVSLDSPDIIKSPASGLDFTSWATQVLTSLLMAGNFYGLRVYSGGSLREVIPLDPDKVKIEREHGRKVFYVDGRPFNDFQILHIPGVMWPGSDVGLSPLEAARQTVGAGIAAEEFAARFFGASATMPGVIETPAEMVPEKAKEMAKVWDRTHGGSANSHKTGVLVGGATWKQTSVTNEQAQFLETRQFTASQIASLMFQIDPAEMGLPVDGSSLTYANLEQRNARKVQVTFLPWIVRLEAALSAFLPRPQYVKINVNGLLRGDMKTRFEAYAVGIQNEFMVPNEPREFEDWAPLPGGGEVVKTAPPADPEMAARDRDAILAAIEAVDARRVADGLERRSESDRTELLRALEHKEPVTVNVQTAAPEMPEIIVPAPIVNVTVDPTPLHVDAPAVTVEAPNVTVEATTVEAHIDVQPAEVKVVPAAPRARRIQRDAQDRIVGVIED